MIALRGPTFTIREELKQLNGRWRPDKSAWVFNDYHLPDIKRIVSLHPHLELEWFSFIDGPIAYPYRPHKHAERIGHWYVFDKEYASSPHAVTLTYVNPAIMTWEWWSANCNASRNDMINLRARLHEQRYDALLIQSPGKPSIVAVL